MSDIENQMKEAVKKILKDKSVDVVIGYQMGSLPLRAVPVAIKSAEEVDKLVWNSFCEANLANYIMKRKTDEKAMRERTRGDKPPWERIGVTAKSHDIRSIVALGLENQFNLENIVIIGLPCPGIIDRKKIDKELDGKEILEGSVSNDTIKIKGKDFEKTFPKKDFIFDSCKAHLPFDSSVCDVVIGELPDQVIDDDFADIIEFEKKTPDERWEYFKEELKDCIRCYACRNVCPMCYCHECFVDASQPLWFGKTTDINDTIIYHIVRAIHLAGRCVNCGACTRACPMGINIRLLNRKMAKTVKERYGFETGVKKEEPAPMATHKLDDPQEFIMDKEVE